MKKEVRSLVRKFLKALVWLISLFLPLSNPSLSLSRFSCRQRLLAWMGYFFIAIMLGALTMQNGNPSKSQEKRAG